MQFCNEQIRTQPLFSPPCASATYGSARMCRRKNSQLRNNVALLAGIYESLGLNELTGGFSAQKASIAERFTKSFHCGAYNKCEYNHYKDDLSPCMDSLIRMSRISEQMVWSPTCPDTRGSTVTSITSY